jgi:hypothetical protein
LAMFCCCFFWQSKKKNLPHSWHLKGPWDVVRPSPEVSLGPPMLACEKFFLLVLFARGC